MLWEDQFTTGSGADEAAGYENGIHTDLGHAGAGSPRRKLLTAKIASGEWDAIIVTHSSFERIGMSHEFQERFLREQIAEYDELLTDRAACCML